MVNNLPANEGDAGLIPRLRRYSLWGCKKVDKTQRLNKAIYRLHCITCGILFPPPGMDPVSPMSSVVEARVLITGLQSNFFFGGWGVVIVILTLFNKIQN